MSEAKRREEKQKSTYDQILAIINQQLKNANMSQPSYNVSTQYQFIQQMQFLEYSLFLVQKRRSTCRFCTANGQFYNTLQQLDENQNSPIICKIFFILKFKFNRHI